jgi:hypothetical protein
VSHPAATPPRLAAVRRRIDRNDADALGVLLDDDFTLGHMTGHRQPSAEWLTEIAAGDTTHHSVRTEELLVDAADTDIPVGAPWCRPRATRFTRIAWHVADAKPISDAEGASPPGELSALRSTVRAWVHGR